MFPLPKTNLAPFTWRYMLDLPLAVDASPTIPTPPEPTWPPPENPEALTALKGTIAWAKLNGGQVTLIGKVVSAVFHTPGTQTVQFFYIQEPDRSNGVKVVPASAVSVEPRDIAIVRGTVMSGETGGECYISADSVDVTGSTALGLPIGMPHKVAAAGSFGLQPALYRDVDNAGTGLNPVGRRLRVCGKWLATVSEGSHTVYYIDDGSGLSRTGNQGLKVLYWRASDAPPIQEPERMVVATGILGAEMADGHPVPVLRVPCGRVIHVRPGGDDNADGLTWATAKATVQAGINAAYSAVPKHEVWAAAGTYLLGQTIDLKDGIGLYGGFAGTESEREQRDWRSNVAALDGNGVCGVVTVATGATNRTAIDGFTIRNGAAYWGGGIYSYDAAPVIANNIVAGNYVMLYDGGGVYLYASNKSPRVLNNTVTDNVCWGNGGGVCCYGGSPVIVGNVIADNTSYFGSGGGLHFTWCSGRVANNAVVGNTAQTSGGGVYVGNSSCKLINDTVAYSTLAEGGTCGGVYLYQSTSQVSNTVVSCNADAGIQVDASPLCMLTYNDVWGHAHNYVGIADPTGTSGNVSTDPLLLPDRIHIGTDPGGNDCKDKGESRIAWGTGSDIDGEYRIQDAAVDMGADEITGCARDIIALSPALAGETPYTLRAYVYSPATGCPLTSRRVDFSVDTGEITAISPEGHIDTPATSGWGTTDSWGFVYVTVTSGTAQDVTVAASTSTCGEQVSDSTVAHVGASFKVGFLYDLCLSDPNPDNDIRNYVDARLSHIASAYYGVSYGRIGSIGSGIDPSFNTVFLAMPTRDLTTSEMTALSSFVQSGPSKRVVLVGERSVGTGAIYNARLNTVAAAIGMRCRFATTWDAYDVSDNRERLCPVGGSHYLLANVNHLWDAASDKFVDGWAAFARPLAYLYQVPPWTWVLEEDTSSAGSRIAIHDSSMFDPSYTQDYDTIPDKNVRFTYNVCTLFPE